MAIARVPGRDRAIGARICLARLQAGLSQKTLGAALHVGRQTVTKYEVGRARVPAALLQDLAAVLGKPAVWFVETDHRALAVAACLELPTFGGPRRQFFRALDVLSPGLAPRTPSRVGEARDAAA